MFSKKGSPQPNTVDTMIGGGSVFEGNIESQGVIRVDGRVNGNVKSESNVFVGDGAVISGDIFANNVFVSGTVQGNINSSGVLKLHSTARLFGDIQVQVFVTDEGAVFHGKCEMADNPKADEPTHKTSKKALSGKDYKKSAVLGQINNETNVKEN